MSEQPEQPTAPVLQYDDYVPSRDKNSNLLVYGYSLGTMAGGAVWGVSLSLFIWLREPGHYLRVFVEGMVVPVAFAMISLLPGVLFLGLCVWTRTKLIREVRFARMRVAFVTGLVGGLFPYALGKELAMSDSALGWYLLAALIWASAYPLASGFWLCYRSYLRD